MWTCANVAAASATSIHTAYICPCCCLGCNSAPASQTRPLLCRNTRDPAAPIAVSQYDAIFASPAGNYTPWQIHISPAGVLHVLSTCTCTFSCMHQSLTITHSGKHVLAFHCLHACKHAIMHDCMHAFVHSYILSFNKAHLSPLCLDSRYLCEV